MACDNIHPVRKLPPGDAWELVRQEAFRAMEAGAIYHSTKRFHPYRVAAIRPESLTIERLNGGNSLIVGVRWAQKVVEQINRAGGRIAAAALTGSVAKKVSLVFLHPHLQWATDGKTIEVTNGINSFDNNAL